MAQLCTTDFEGSQTMRQINYRQFRVHLIPGACIDIITLLSALLGVDNVGQPKMICKN